MPAEGEFLCLASRCKKEERWERSTPVWFKLYCNMEQEYWKCTMWKKAGWSKKEKRLGEWGKPGAQTGKIGQTYSNPTIW